MIKNLALVCAMIACPAYASEDIPDQYPASVLYSKPVEVIPNVFSAIGATAPPTYENAGHNNNLSFIITGDGVVVINGGGSYQLAAALHTEIKVITEQPVKLVLNENGQVIYRTESLHSKSFIPNQCRTLEFPSQDLPSGKYQMVVVSHTDLGEKFGLTHSFER